MPVDKRSIVSPRKRLLRQQRTRKPTLTDAQRFEQQLGAGNITSSQSDIDAEIAMKEEERLANKRLREIPIKTRDAMPGNTTAKKEVDDAIKGVVDAQSKIRDVQGGRVVKNYRPPKTYARIVEERDREQVDKALDSLQNRKGLERSFLRRNDGGLAKKTRVF